MASTETYTIGKVVKRLSAAYPDLTVSKVRFLEAEGLVSPTRTKSGYRMYSEADIARIEAVLRLQKTHFYPLAVIKERLDALDAGEPVQELEGTLPAGDDPETLARRHSLDDASRITGAPVAFVRSLQEAGLVELVSERSGRQLVEGRDLPLIRAAWELKRYGIDPRFLKAQAQFANRELPLFKQVLASAMGRQASFDDPHTLQVFDSTLERLIELSDSVTDCIIRNAMRREFNHPAVAPTK